MSWQFQIHQLLYIAAAMFLGGIIGLEREILDKPAGFRTHMLVAGTSALLMMLGEAVMHFYPVAETLRLQADPIRLIQAIIVGISFICAGTILRHRDREQIEGLTTAATILLASTIGIVVALRQMVLAAGMIGLTLFILTIFRNFEIRLKIKRQKSPPAGDR
jgi:putative Mg2+ transporter-C (MgtC) family protein